jgi:S-formylglutathione hydrolase FrmB
MTIIFNTRAKGRLLIVLLLFLSVFASKSDAATVDTVATYSQAMQKSINTVVIKPDDYSTAKSFPVLYLLHGFSGKYSDWILKVPSIKGLSDEYNMIIVCPDGGFAGWYFDSPMSKDWQFETFIVKEVVGYVDGHYSTIKDRRGRAITGLSMGGHGALYLAFKHQDIFGAAGSMSGLVDLEPFPKQFGIEQVLGKYTDYPDRWKTNSVVNMVDMLKPNSLAITFDVGCDDFLYKVNLNLHNIMLEKKIPHDFTVRPGSHTWEYWGNSINYQALFFSRYFNGK